MTDLTHISISQYGTWTRCRQQWFNRYVLGEKLPPGIAAHIGSGVHGGVEFDLKDKVFSGVDKPLEDVLDAASTSYDERLKKGGVFFNREDATKAQKIMGAGKDQTIALTKAWHADLAPTIQPVLVEKKIDFLPDGLDVPLLGIIDCLDANHVIRDTKTSKSKWNQAKADKELQPPLYRELVKMETGKYPDKFVYDVLVKTKDPYCQQIETTRDDDDFRILIMKLNLMIKEIDSGNIGPAASDAWNCSPNWCGWWGSCEWIPDRLRRLPNV